MHTFGMTFFANSWGQRAAGRAVRRLQAGFLLAAALGLACGGSRVATAALAPSSFMSSSLAPSVRNPRQTLGDYGVLQRFAPQSPTTWWAIVESNLTAKTFVVRTIDSGRRWRDVTPPVRLVSSSYFLDRAAGWLEAGALFPPRSEPVYRTLNGGRSWQRLGRVASDCQLDFVDARHGWCARIGAAAGSASVALYRTTDGGSTWTLASHTAVPPAASTPGALPFGCDKTITFTSPTVGWASSFCNGGSPYLYRSRDGGSHWRLLPRVPFPSGASTPQGEGL